MAAVADDTIVALSSGRLPAGVAVIRISGPRTRFAVETISGPLPADRRAELRALRAADGAVIDRGLVLFFPGPASFTGEDCAELHCHGSRAVVSVLLATLSSFPGVRLAEAGEFTRRAFLNGKMDLTQAEALADLAAAETEAQRRLAMRVAEGALRGLYEGWRRRLIHARAMIEAELDFSDEGDVPGSVADAVMADIATLREELDDHRGGHAAAEIVREGYDVVIAGPPNVGKSSLLNALAGRPAAIVSEEAGTTRDLIEVALDLGGFKVRLTDTAGIRGGAGKVESIGIERARQRLMEADLVLALQDLSSPLVRVEIEESVARKTLRVGTKADLVGSEVGAADVDHRISVLTGHGLTELLETIYRRAEAQASRASDVVPVRARQAALLQDASAELATALDVEDRVIRAEHLRLASDSLGRIVGTVDVEDLLDVIFSQFCIGK